MKEQMLNSLNHLKQLNGNPFTLKRLHFGYMNIMVYTKKFSIILKHFVSNVKNGNKKDCLMVAF